MKVFLSWSKDRSKVVAMALRTWIRMVLQEVDPWMNTEQIQAGDRWSIEVTRALNECDFGILCMTPENKAEPWLLFEAGALSKKMETGAVIPYLFDMQISDLQPPLSQFQAKLAEKEPTFDLLRALNERLKKPVPPEDLREIFEALWPKLDEKLRGVPDVPSVVPAQKRDTSEILEELVTLVRGLDTRLGVLEKDAEVLRLLPNSITTGSLGLPPSDPEMIKRVARRLLQGRTYSASSPLGGSFNVVREGVGSLGRVRPAGLEDGTGNDDGNEGNTE